MSNIIEAAKKGNADAQNAVGNYYYQQKKYKQAAIWYGKAGKQGQATACVSLGYLYLYGLGINKNAQNAIQLFSYAAQQENPYGMAAMGILYLKGEVIKRDEFQAYLLLNEAAKKNDKAALYYLGVMHEQGIFVRRDYTKAREYYKKAYERGYLAAKDKLIKKDHVS